MSDRGPWTTCPECGHNGYFMWTMKLGCNHCGWRHEDGAGGRRWSLERSRWEFPWRDYDHDRGAVVVWEETDRGTYAYDWSQCGAGVFQLVYEG